MRYLPTPDQLIERLRKKAKKLQRTGGGKHSELLNRVAKSEGYDHWHHVVLCNEQSKRPNGLLKFRHECDAIAQAELDGVVKAVITGPEIGVGPFVLFSTGIGDAWALDPNEDLAMCLVWRSEKIAPDIRDDPNVMEIHWHGMFELLGDFFHVDTEHPDIRERSVGGYPLDAVRKLLDRAQTSMRKMADVIGQVDSVEMSPEVIAHMIKKGWDRERLEEMQAQGFSYSPGRDTLLSPVMTDEDFDDEDLDEDETEPRTSN